MDKKGVLHTTLETGYAIWEMLVMLLIVIFVASVVSIYINVDDKSNEVFSDTVISRLRFCAENNFLDDGLNNCFGKINHYIKLEYKDKEYVLNSGIKSKGRLVSYSLNVVQDDGGIEVAKIEFSE